MTEQNIDKRLMDRQLDAGDLKSKTLDKHLGGLADLAEEVDVVEVGAADEEDGLAEA
jgi:hypothetical protein